MKIEKLELKHLAPYLPYGLEGWKPYLNRRYIVLLGAHNIVSFLNDVDFIELRPLSQLTEEIVVNGEKFVPLERLALSLEYDVEPWDIDDRIGYFFDDNTFDDSQGYEVCISKDLKFEVWYDDKNSGSMQSATALTYSHIQLLLEWHFDLFDLIENNLAIEKK